MFIALLAFRSSLVYLSLFKDAIPTTEVIFRLLVYRDYERCINTGSLFYLTAFVCHFPPLFRRARGPRYYDMRADRKGEAVVILNINPMFRRGWLSLSDNSVTPLRFEPCTIHI